MKISDKCRGCGICITSCPSDAIRIETGIAVINKDICMECGLCKSSCPFGFIID